MSAGVNQTWNNEMNNQEGMGVNLDTEVSMGVMLCADSKPLARALATHFETEAARQTSSGPIPAYPLQVVTPNELVTAPSDLSNTVVVIVTKSDEENLRLLDLVVERLPGVATIIGMIDFDPKAESLYMNHGAFDVTLLPGTPKTAAQALHNRIQRVERIMLELSQARAAEQQQRLNNSVLDRALSKIPQAIAVLDPRGRIEYVNRAMSRLTHSPKHAMEGAKIGSWLTPVGGAENPEATLMMRVRYDDSDSEFTGTIKRSDGVKVDTKITATPFNMDGQQKCILVVQGGKEHGSPNWDAADNIYNIYSYTRSNRSDFIQWLDDVSGQVRDADSKQLGVLTVRLHGLDDLQDDEIHSFTDDVADDAAKILSLMASDYSFGIWDHGVLAIGIMCELPRGFNALLSRLELLLEGHPLAEHGVICLEGIVGIAEPAGASIMATLIERQTQDPGIEDGVYVGID